MTHQALADVVAGMEDVDGHVPRLGVGDAGPEELPELVHAGLDVDVVVVLLHAAHPIRGPDAGVRSGAPGPGRAGRFAPVPTPRMAMKVAFVVPRYGADIRGGAETGARMLAERLVADRGLRRRGPDDVRHRRHHLARRVGRGHDGQQRRACAPHPLGGRARRALPSPLGTAA